MKQKKCMITVSTACILVFAMVLAMFMTVFAAGTETRYNLKDLFYTKSSDSLPVSLGGNFYYIGNNLESSVGQSAEFYFSVDAPGKYEVKVATKKHNSKAIFQTSINGEAVGNPVDQYALSGSDNQSVTIDLGSVEIAESGEQRVGFTIVGKNEKVNTYQIAVEALILVACEEQEVPDIPNVEWKEPAVSESGNVVAYPMPYIYSQSGNFRIKADGVDIPVIAYRGEYDYAEFSMNGVQDGGDAVHIEITGTQAIQSYEISPRKLGIEAQINGNTLSFDLEDAAYLIVRLNNGKRLAIAADKMETDVPEKSGEGIFNILDEPYNAERTGTLLSTEAIQKAIDDASAYGTANGTRGTVYVPNGVYQTSSLVMKSNMELYLEGGAVLRATLDGSKYPIRGKKDSIGKYVVQLIYTENNKLAEAYDADFLNSDNYIESENMRIYGRGTVDARGRDFEEASNLLIQSLIPVNCSNFTADGIILRDTSIWSVAPGLSNDLEFLNLKIFNTFNHEDDCIDINNCQNVVVKNAIGIALDDPFSTKTWEVGELFRAWCGKSEPNENILFEDCLSWSYCYGFKVGQGSWYDQKNITFRNGTVYDCAVGLGVHHKYGEASLYDITFENIDIEHVNSENDGHKTWLHMQAITGGREGILPIQNVTIKDIHVYDKGRSTAKLVGFSDTYKIQNIQFENIYMEELGKNAETLEELDIKDLFFYCTDLTVDGKALPDAPKVIIYQLEDLMEEAELSENCPNLGVGEGFVYIGNAVNDWASFPIEVEAGTYTLEIMMKQHSSKGIFQLYVNGEPVGEPYDQYYNGNKTGITKNFGTVTFGESGVQDIKFEIVGKNASSGGYALVIDAVKLTEQIPEVILESLEIVQMPQKTTYYVGEEADYTGLLIDAVYSDGSRKTLSAEQYHVTGFGSEEAGTVDVTVEFEGLTAGFSVEVIQKAVAESLEIAQMPQKMTYYVGEEADYTGLAVAVIYSDGTKEALTEDQYSITGFDSSAAGSSIITVEFEGLTAEFEVTVEEEKEPEAVLETIEITKMPQKMTYYVGEKADYTGLVVEAFYSDGSQKNLTREQYSVTGFSSKTEGTITLTVKFEGLTAVFEVEIVAMSEDVETALSELEVRIASASNAQSIQSVADDALSLFDTMEVLTEKVMGVVKKLEDALIRLCKDITKSTIEVDAEVSSRYGISKSKIKVEGAALTAYAMRGGAENASPSNASLRVNPAEMELDELEIPEEYEKETAVLFKMELIYQEGNTEENIELSTPISIKLPMLKEMTEEDGILILRYDDVGNLLETILPQKTANGLSFAVRELGTFAIVKEKDVVEEPEPDDGEETTKPDDGEETTKPDAGEETTKPDDGEETTKPDDGEETTKPDDGEETTKPDAGEETTKPDAGEETTKPDAGEETTKPDDGEETTKPDDGEETTKPDAGEETTKPDDGEETTKPDDGEETTKPDAGEETTKPDDGEETTKPDAGEETTKPDAGEETTKPDAGEETTKPDDGEESNNNGNSNISRRTSRGKSAKATHTVETWKKDDYGWWYMLTDGSYPVNRWMIINNQWYFFDSVGYMETGWKFWNGQWYYMNEDGQMQTGWVLVNGQWYYLNLDGTCLLNARTPDGYYVNESGAWVE